MRTLTSKAEYAPLLDSYDTWMFDCDGVLWNGDRLIDGAVDALSYLRSQSLFRLSVMLSRYSCRKPEKNIIFVTNNATKSRRHYKGKFDKMGVQAEIVRIFSSQSSCHNGTHHRTKYSAPHMSQVLCYLLNFRSF